MLKQLYHFLHPRFQSLFMEYRVKFAPRYGHGKPPHQLLHDLINQHREGYKALLHSALKYRETLCSILPASQQRDPASPAWNNGYLPGLDMIMLYTMIAENRPARYVEIGSGNSTKVAYKAKTEQSPATEIISIDPHPRAEIDNLASRVYREPFESLGLNLAEMLQPGDILFVDNSHRLLPNSDVMVFFLELLPALQPGVIVQVHDVYLPYDYPQFMCDRFYSEQYALAINLMANPQRYTPLLPNYFIHCDEELSAIPSPFWEHPNLRSVERHGGSFWMKISR